MADDIEISVEAIPTHIRGKNAALSSIYDIPDEGIHLEDVERKLIANAIDKAKGNKSKAAQLLGITRRKLYSMMERFGGF